MFADAPQKQPSGYAGKLLIWCLPALALLLISIFGIGLIPARACIPSFVLIVGMGLIVSWMVTIFRSQQTAGGKAAGIALCLVILGIVGVCCLFAPRMLHRCVKENARERFEAHASAMYPEVFAAPLDVGAVNATEYHTFTYSLIIFESRSYALLCDYSQEEYQRELAAVEDRYSFRTEPLQTGHTGDDGGDTKTSPETRIGDDCFRVLAPGDGDSLPFYKQCLLMMHNDTTHQIAYIVFSDIDLDVTDSLADLIRNECGWQYIRR